MKPPPNLDYEKENELLKSILSINELLMEENSGWGCHVGRLKEDAKKELMQLWEDRRKARQEWFEKVFPRKG